MAPPALVGTPATATNMSDSSTVATPGSAASGEWLLAVVAGRTLADGSAGTDLILAGFTALGTLQSPDDGNYRTTWLKKSVDAGDIAGTTYALSNTGAMPTSDGGAVVFRCDVEPTLDVSGVTASFGTDCTLPSVTTTEADVLLLASLHRQGGGAALPAPPSPYSDEGEAQGYAAVGADDVATAGSVGGETWTGLSFGSYWSTVVALHSAAPAPILSQEGYRYGTDDGTEAGHGWEAAQDTDPASLAALITYLLRIIVNETAGGTITTGFKIQYKRDDEADDQWRDVE